MKRLLQTIIVICMSLSILSLALNQIVYQTVTKQVMGNRLSREFVQSINQELSVLDDQSILDITTRLTKSDVSYEMVSYYLDLHFSATLNRQQESFVENTDLSKKLSQTVLDEFKINNIELNTSQLKAYNQVFKEEVFVLQQNIFDITNGYFAYKDNTGFYLLIKLYKFLVNSSFRIILLIIILLCFYLINHKGINLKQFLFNLGIETILSALLTLIVVPFLFKYFVISVTQSIYQVALVLEMGSIYPYCFIVLVIGLILLIASYFIPADNEDTKTKHYLF